MAFSLFSFCFCKEGKAQQHHDVCVYLLYLLYLQANEYQVQSKRLPIALRDWPAYKDCRRTIDDFLNLLPLFQSLTHKSIRPRWVGGWLGGCRLTAGKR
jgi:hypothetical protein